MTSAKRKKGVINLNSMLSNYGTPLKPDVHTGNKCPELYLISIPSCLDLKELNGLTLVTEPNYAADINLNNSQKTQLEYRFTATNMSRMKQQVLFSDNEDKNMSSYYSIKSPNGCVTIREKLKIETQEFKNCIPRRLPPNKPAGLKRRLNLFGSNNSKSETHFSNNVKEELEVKKEKENFNLQFDDSIKTPKKKKKKKLESDKTISEKSLKTKKKKKKKLRSEEQCD